MESKRYGNRREFLNRTLDRGKKYGGPVLRESASTTVLVGGLVYLLKDREFLRDLRESFYNMRHAGRTGYEMISGGPEGMKATKRLEDALEIVEVASEGNKEAREALEKYVLERKELVGKLGGIYKENETLSREAERLGLQLQGALKNFFEVGNSLKPDFWRKIDDTIIRIYGQDPIEAREKSLRLKEFYQNVRKFYDSREKNEHTVKEFCDYLVKVKEESIEQNRRFNEIFPNVIARVKEGYETEDGLFRTSEGGLLGARRDVRKDELKKMGKDVKDYRGKVDRTEDEVRAEMPIEPFREKNFVDYITNPVILGLAGAVFLKGISNISNTTRRGLTYLTLAPYYLGKEIAKGTGKAIKKFRTEKLKKAGDEGVR